MPLWAPFSGSRLGTGWSSIINATAGSIDLKADKAAAAFRFTAQTTEDVKSVTLRFGTVTAYNTVRVQVWAINAATGKPSAIYDAAATYDIVVGTIPSATLANSIQVVTFATLPTTGLVVGDEYAIVVLDIGGATALNLAGQFIFQEGVVAGNLPTAVLAATDYTTPTNFAETTNALPVCVVNFENSVYNIGFSPTYAITLTPLYGANYAGAKFVLAAPISATGIYAAVSRTTAVPTGNLQLQLFKDNNTAVTGTAHTINIGSLTTQITSTGARLVRHIFPAPVTLTPGTYRISLNNTAADDSSHAWNAFNAEILDAAAQNSSFQLCTSTNSGVGWSDVAKPFLGGILISDLPASGSPVFGDMNGGM